MKFKIIIILIIFSNLSCDYFYSKKIAGNYYIIAIDLPFPKNISYDLGDGSYIGVAKGNVIEYAFNKDYILAKQHPAYWEGNEIKINNSIVNYVIIPIKNKVSKWPDENKIGPLTKEEFEQMREQLSIPDSLKFIKVE